MSDDLDAIFSEVASEDAGEVQEQPDEGSEVADDVVETDEVDDTVETETDEAQDAEPEAEETTVSEDVWNWEAVADQEVPIVVDGQTEMVKLSELRNGYMRQSDYTRKTQSLSEAQREAQWARDVQEALNRNPEGTLRAIAQAYGLTSQQEQPNPLTELDEDVRPWAERTLQAEGNMTAMEQRLQQLEVDRMKAEIRSEVQALQARYEDFDAPSVLQMAAAENISLENAHLIISARRAQEAKQSASAAQKVASEAASKVREQSDAKRRAAKKDAAGTLDKSYRSVNDISADEFNSIDELFQLISESS